MYGSMADSAVELHPRHPRLTYTCPTGPPGDPAAAPPADTRRVYPDRAPCDAPPGYCACTFYLVFKEPDSSWRPLPARSSSGEPCNLTKSLRFCQSPCAFWRRAIVPDVPRAWATEGMASL